VSPLRLSIEAEPLREAHRELTTFSRLFFLSFPQIFPQPSSTCILRLPNHIPKPIAPSSSNWPPPFPRTPQPEANGSYDPTSSSPTPSSSANVPHHSSYLSHLRFERSGYLGPWNAALSSSVRIVYSRGSRRGSASLSSTRSLSSHRRRGRCFEKEEEWKCVSCGF